MTLLVVMMMTIKAMTAAVVGCPGPYPLHAGHDDDNDNDNSDIQ